jgi:hypothetical protein
MMPLLSYDPLVHTFIEIVDSKTPIFCRHLRFLIKSAEELIRKPASLEELQNQAAVTKTVIRSIQTDLAATKEQQALAAAQAAEEKEGRQNET